MPNSIEVNLDELRIDSIVRSFPSHLDAGSEAHIALVNQHQLHISACVHRFDKADVFAVLNVGIERGLLGYGHTGAQRAMRRSKRIQTRNITAAYLAEC